MHVFTQMAGTFLTVAEVADHMGAVSKQHVKRAHVAEFCGLALGIFCPIPAGSSIRWIRIVSSHSPM